MREIGSLSLSGYRVVNPTPSMALSECVLDRMGCELIYNWD